PDTAVAALRRSSRALKLKPERGMPYLLGGVDLAIDCVGSKSSLDLALRTTRAGGRVVLAGLPTHGADLTPVWFRELEVVGAYTSGAERLRDGTTHHTFDLALDLAPAAPRPRGRGVPRAEVPPRDEGDLPAGLAPRGPRPQPGRPQCAAEPARVGATPRPHAAGDEADDRRRRHLAAAPADEGPRRPP